VEIDKRRAMKAILVFCGVESMAQALVTHTLLSRPVNEPTHSTGSLELDSIKLGSKSSSILFSSALYCTSSLD
jgi:hypothetical protein